MQEQLRPLQMLAQVVGRVERVMASTSSSTSSSSV
jgi:hypothetical protein